MKTENSSRVIPETSFRGLYDLLRLFTKKEFHEQCAVEFNRKPEAFDTVFSKSYLHCSKYDNRKEKFHDRQIDLTNNPKYSSPNSTTAHKFALEIAKQKKVTLDGPFSFEFADYEVNPFRTTNGEGYESGKSSQNSGKGGVDLLLASTDDGTPIVGEIKAEDDTTLLLALIQSLTYALELSTPFQTERLCNSYPNQFKLRPQGPLIDIFIFQVKASRGRHVKKIQENVLEIASKILKQEKIKKVIRNIVFLNTNFYGCSLSDLKVLKSFSSQTD